MDIKAHKFNKGDLVRLRDKERSTLGIVTSQDGVNIEVQWIQWSSSHIPYHGYKWRAYNLVRVEKAG